MIARAIRSAEGLEFDLGLLAEPGARRGGVPLDRAADIESAVDRYVAMTRTTGELVILDPSDY
ncbi:hypothetical protein ASF88_09210 [Leifsonia sp. Leaf336]|uniref:hypothetical protein n=1 Tax=Leifsonia sp. Leaf336 TaxID=1736341 RepID=UPI0006F353B9|nr:hypothetical protein [Leifsonia sp. Leaf336]KQR51785.1 hypothetical protein ASF88_09210 [Leifsonia sp. Leaf336]